MSGRLETFASALARARVAAAVERIAAAELPAGLVAQAEGDSVTLRGRGLARRLAFDPRVAALGRLP